MHDSRMIQALHAAISRSSWSEVERAANALRDDEQSARKILAGTDIGSLPHDMTTADMAKLRMATISTLTAERDALKRERDEARLALADFMDITRPSSIPAFEDHRYGKEVAELGHRIGFGALMSSASASWRKALEAGPASGGEFVVGPCMATLTNCRAKARAVLARTGEPTDAP